jgi:hypothetical protein
MLLYMVNNKTYGDDRFTTIDGVGKAKLENMEVPL